MSRALRGHLRREATPGGEITMMSYPACNKTLFGPVIHLFCYQVNYIVCHYKSFNIELKLAFGEV